MHYSLNGSACNLTSHIDLLDFAYLATNAYHKADVETLKVLGAAPKSAKKLQIIESYIDSKKFGWYHIQLPSVYLPRPKSGFYVDLYAKITKYKIEHFVIAFRGTTYDLSTGDVDDLETDFKTWYKTAISQFNHGKTSESPDFSPYIKGRIAGFMMRVSDVVAELKAEKLVSDRPQFWLTGHSLGGALAHYALVHSVAKGHVFRSVAFNPPGIGEMPGVHTHPAIEDRALTVRASYDFISAVSQPYGEVVNVYVPEDYKAAKETFTIADKHAHPSSPLMNLIKTKLWGNTLENFKMTLDAKNSVMGQHGMTNLLKAIASDYRHALLDFNHLKKLAKEHSEHSYDMFPPELINQQGLMVVA